MFQLQLVAMQHLEMAMELLLTAMVPPWRSMVLRATMPLLLCMMQEFRTPMGPLSLNPCQPTTTLLPTLNSKSVKTVVIREERRTHAKIHSLYKTMIIYNYRSLQIKQKTGKL